MQYTQQKVYTNMVAWDEITFIRFTGNKQATYNSTELNKAKEGESDKNMLNYTSHSLLTS